VLVWDFVDLITPVMKLESPQEVFCFRLNPTQPDIAVGGTLSGQVSII
jgi:dynein intermediate chain 3, axonemal